MNGEFQRLGEGKLLIFLKRLVDTEITLHLRPRNEGNQSAEIASL
jgi:predicted XRE-type DNA-binding protein